HLLDGTDFGTVDAIDRIGRTLDVKKRGVQADVHPSAVFAHSVVNSVVLADVLARIADDVVQNGVVDGTQYQAARQLLLSRSPRVGSDPFQPHGAETAVPSAARIAPHLDETILAIQGPPGAGKTFTGARMTSELVRRGRRVGVTAVSHKVIRNLLDAALNA